MAGWNNLSTRQKVAVALGVSAGAAVLCVCYVKYRSRRALESPECPEDTCELRFKISEHGVKRLTADGDDIIGQFSKQTGARIELSQHTDSDGFRELTIRGSPDQIRQTKELLASVFNDDTLIQVEMHLPDRYVCRIIGPGGQQIQDISKTSGAKIQCERQPENSLGPARCITITGSWGQVEAAKSLIEKVMAEDTAVPSNFLVHKKENIAIKKKDAQPPSEKSIPPNTDCSSESYHTAESPEETLAEDLEPQNIANTTFNIYKFEVPSPDFNFQADEYVDVNVSALENPEHFWVQILGSRSSQLDKLTMEMSDFYSKQKRGMSEIQVGDIVAAQFRNDFSWYRAEVLGVLEKGSVDLYYVDYGDNWQCPKENLFPLRSDFLSLPFQAVECALANVAPKGGQWSHEALNAFESLTYCAKWKPLLAKIASFPSPGISHFQIHLYDPSGNPKLDIGQELVSRGLAVECRKSPVKSGDDMLVSRLLEEVTSLSMMPEPTSLTEQQEEEQRLESDESIEVMRADMDPSPDLQDTGTPSPLPHLECTAKPDSLEQSMSKILLSNSDHSTSSSQSTAPPASLAEDSSPVTSGDHTDSSGTSSDHSTSSTCTASEGPSLLSTSSLDDSSIYSPRGCFYYLTDEVSTSSIFTASAELITISSDSEEESEKRRAPANSGTKHDDDDDDLLNSSSNDVIVVEDDA
ncbi:PREDICTED: tudor and KH domain-containing protein [Nanorana parkeri]|uniref:tudor and KH domain-containing protein n=1 Tax=Nanorana parkeri TaxID=125878 RepID=UPI00085450DB|nr:PREDICTED: tudor and KH domain-containing protein [Nanorana parkeri]